MGDGGLRMPPPLPACRLRCVVGLSGGGARPLIGGASTPTAAMEAAAAVLSSEPASGSISPASLLLLPPNTGLSAPCGRSAGLRGGGTVRRGDLNGDALLLPPLPGSIPCGLPLEADVLEAGLPAAGRRGDSTTLPNALTCCCDGVECCCDGDCVRSPPSPPRDSLIGSRPASTFASIARTRSAVPCEAANRKKSCSTSNDTAARSAGASAYVDAAAEVLVTTAAPRACGGALLVSSDMLLCAGRQWIRRVVVGCTLQKVAVHAVNSTRRQFNTNGVAVGDVDTADSPSRN